MKLSQWVRTHPISALLWTEALAALLGIVCDVFLAAFVDPYPTLLHPWTIALSGFATLVCMVAVFSIPHRPNRRYATLAIAFVTLLFIGSQPPYGVSAIVLAGILACRLSFAFGISGALIAWVAGSAAVLLRVVVQSHGEALTLPAIYSIATLVVLFGFIFGIIAVMATYATAAVTTGAARERARIALDLHDALGHGLTTLSVQLENATRLRSVDPSKADEYVVQGLNTTGSMLIDVRETVGLLRGADDQHVPFGALIRQLTSDYSQTHDSVVRVRIEVRAEPSGSVSIALFRFTQEALTNIARHANASEVYVNVVGTNEDVTVSIADNGRGFTSQEEGSGLRSMRERIASVGGTLRVNSAPGLGTSVEAIVPRRYAQ